MNTALRVVAMLVDPLSEWAKIEKEPTDPVKLMLSYVAPLALIPAVFGIIGACVIGVAHSETDVVHAPIVAGLLGAIFGYLANFVVVAVLGLFIGLAAPLFGSRMGFSGGLRLAVYSYTPVWLVGVFLLLPGLRFLMLTGFYGAYLLLAGLSLTARAPGRKTAGFAVLIIAVACVLTWLAAGTQRALLGVPLA